MGPTRRLLQKDCECAAVLNTVRFEVYLNTTRQLLAQADAYYEMAADEEAPLYAYTFYKRYMIMVLERLPRHNAYSAPQYARERARLSREAKVAMPKLEEVAQRLDDEDALLEEMQLAAELDGGFTPARAPQASAPPAAAAAGAPPLSAAAVPDDALLQRNGRNVDLALMLSTLSLTPGQQRRLQGSDDVAYPQVRGGGSNAYTPAAAAVTPRRRTPTHRLRKLILPTSLVARFEVIAQPNTERGRDGIETCGILAGRVVNGDALMMTTLIVPPQTGSSDSCTATSEELVFSYMLEFKLITLGWIHTHPRQDCFMSSVDLHTHAGYQVMLPEAVAVVIAPTDAAKRVGVFRLEAPHGLRLILDCRLKGFHPHPTDVTIYGDARVEWDARAPLSVVDLRKASR